MTKWEYQTAPIPLTTRPSRCSTTSAPTAGSWSQIAHATNPGGPGRLLQAAARGVSTPPRSAWPSSGWRCPRWPSRWRPTCRRCARGDHVFTSGQLPMRSGELIATGKVGGEVTAEEAYECAQQCALNAHRRGQGRDRRPGRGRAGWSRSWCSSPRPPTSPASPASPTASPSCSAHVFGDAGVHARSAVGVAVAAARRAGRGRARWSRSRPPSEDPAAAGARCRRDLVDARRASTTTAPGSPAEPRNAATVVPDARGPAPTRRPEVYYCGARSRWSSPAGMASSPVAASTRATSTPRSPGPGRRRPRGPRALGIDEDTGAGAGLRRGARDLRGVGRAAGRRRRPTRSSPTPPATTGRPTGSRWSRASCR